MRLILIHRMLVKYTDKLLAGKTEPVNIFFPLCGKNVDMQWFYSQGHNVYGADIADEALDDFFTGHQINRSIEYDESKKIKIHSTDDGRLKIFQGNFLTLKV